MKHPYLDLPTPIVIGHRGCAGEAPENTLTCFEAGLAAGAAILESDVHLTRDGEPVLIHDDAVDRVSGGTGRIASLTLEELQRLDAGHHFSPDGGASHPFRGRGLCIPTLHEALEAFPGARFNLELKEDLPEIVERTVDVVTESKRDALTLLTAAEDELMRRLRNVLERRAPAIAQGACAADVLDFVSSARDGSAPRPGPVALQIPAGFGGSPLATHELIEHAHIHGVQVHVWTINEPAEMTRLLDLGVDGIVTDHPARLARLIEARRDRS